MFKHTVEGVLKQFSKLIDKLEQIVESRQRFIDEKKETISLAALAVSSASLEQIRARAVAAKLRDLIKE